MERKLSSFCAAAIASINRNGISLLVCICSYNCLCYIMQEQDMEDFKENAGVFVSKQSSKLTEVSCAF